MEDDNDSFSWQKMHPELHIDNFRFHSTYDSADENSAREVAKRFQGSEVREYGVNITRINPQSNHVTQDGWQKIAGWSVWLPSSLLHLAELVARL